MIRKIIVLMLLATNCHAIVVAVHPPAESKPIYPVPYQFSLVADGLLVCDAYQSRVQNYRYDIIAGCDEPNDPNSIFSGFHIISLKDFFKKHQPCPNCKIVSTVYFENKWQIYYKDESGKR